jgi:hypothetical protein
VLRPTLMCTVPLILEREVVSRLCLILVRHLDSLSLALFLQLKFGELFVGCRRKSFKLNTTFYNFLFTVSVPDPHLL